MFVLHDVVVYSASDLAAARNPLPLGDLLQLSQVRKGQHCEPVDCSALGWPVGDASTLDPTLGYFLAQSWRMHSAVCGRVSRYSNGGRLAPELVADTRVLAGQDPGVHNIFVDRDGNTTDSAEETERMP